MHEEELPSCEQYYVHVGCYSKDAQMYVHDYRPSFSCILYTVIAALLQGCVYQMLRAKLIVCLQCEEGACEHS